MKAQIMERLAREIVECLKEALQPLHVLIQLLLLLAMFLLRQRLTMVKFVGAGSLIRQERSLGTYSLSPRLVSAEVVQHLV